MIGCCSCEGCWGNDDMGVDGWTVGVSCGLLLLLTVSLCKLSTDDPLMIFGLISCTPSTDFCLNR